MAAGEVCGSGGASRFGRPAVPLVIGRGDWRSAARAADDAVGVAGPARDTPGRAVGAVVAVGAEPARVSGCSAAAGSGHDAPSVSVGVPWTRAVVVAFDIATPPSGVGLVHTSGRRPMLRFHVRPVPAINPALAHRRR